MIADKQSVRYLAIYLLLSALFYAPILLGLRTFPDGDFTHHFLPFSLFQQNEWLAGRWLPVWNPYTYGGHPFLADAQTALFYPVGDLLLLLTLPFNSPAARLYFLQVEAVLHIALAGFFTHLLVQRLTGNRQAAFTAGALLAFSGYLTGYPPLQLAILRTAIWLPLILWLLLRAVDEPTRWRWWIGASLAWATAFLAGHPQTFLHLSYAVVGWMGMLLMQNFSTQRRKDAEAQRGQVTGVAYRRRAPFTIHHSPFTIHYFFPSSSHHPIILLTVFLAVALLTAAFSAVQLLPSLEFTRFSVRASVDYAYVSEGFPVQDTWQLLFPAILSQFSPLFIGVPGLFLALLGLSHLRAIRHSPFTIHHSLFFLLTAALALLLSYGDNGFLYPLFYRYAPGWNLFRGQERAVYLVAFGLSVLAGYGMAALPGLSLRTRRLAGGALVGVVAGSGLLFDLFWQAAGRGALPNERYWLVMSLSLLVALAVAWLLWEKEWQPRRGWALAALGAAVLLWANGGTNVDDFDPANKTLLAPEVAAVQAAQTGGRVYNEYRVYEDYGMSIAAEDVWGSSPLRLARYAALFDNFPLDRMWRLMGVETVLTWRHGLFVPSNLLAEFPQATDTTFLHRLTEANPRAWLVQNVQIADDAAALALLADHNFDISQTVLLPPDAAPSLLHPFTPSPLHPTIQLSRSAPNRLHITLTDNPGGLLVLSENWLPGWRVQSPIPNIQYPIPILRANLTLLALPLPAGDLAFDLVYWPDSLTWGFVITGSALLALGVVLLFRRKIVGRNGIPPSPPSADGLPVRPNARASRWIARLQEAVILILLFLLVFAVYRGSKGAVPMTDAAWTLPIALSLINEGNLDLDEYPYTYTDGGLSEAYGHRVSFFPVGVPVAVAPLVFVIDRVFRTVWSLNLYEHLKNAPDWELVARLHQLIASVFASLTVLVVYLTGRLSLGRHKSLLLAGIFAFCTSAWSTASRDLWQHTVSIFVVALLLYLLLQIKKQPGLALFCCGLLVAAAYVTRPTNSVLALFVTVYVLFEQRKYTASFLAGIVVVAAPFVLYNLHFFASPLAPYYLPGRIGNNPFFLTALVGNLVSPARGLFIYSPILLFVVYGVALKIRSRQFQRLDAFLVGVIPLHWLIISSFRHWWGGASFGPRFFTDALPLFAFFLIPVIDQIARPAFWSRRSRQAVGVLFAASLFWSLFVHYRGSTQPAAWAWNGAFYKVIPSVDAAPARLWDWSDPQFWRGLRPAAAAIAPNPLCFTVKEGESAASNQTLTILNRGDETFNWTLETPNRVFQQPAFNQVPGLGYAEPELTVDSAGYGVGNHLLGGLYFSASAADHKPVRNSPSIVPAILRVLPAAVAQGAEQASFSDPCTVVASDIRVDGQVRQADDSRLLGIYGSGWYDMERAGEASWRWATSPARIFIFASQRQALSMTSTPIALREQQTATGFGERGTLRVSANDRLIGQLAVQVGQSFVVEVPVQPGWNPITLELISGNVRPSDIDPSSGDARLLSFALGPIDLHE